MNLLGMTNKELDEYVTRNYPGTEKAMELLNRFCDMYGFGMSFGNKNSEPQLSFHKQVGEFQDIHSYGYVGSDFDECCAVFFFHIFNPGSTDDYLFRRYNVFKPKSYEEFDIMLTLGGY